MKKAIIIGFGILSYLLSPIACTPSQKSEPQKSETQEMIQARTFVDNETLRGIIDLCFINKADLDLKLDRKFEAYFGLQQVLGNDGVKQTISLEDITKASEDVVDRYSKQIKQSKPIETSLLNLAETVYEKEKIETARQNLQKVLEESEWLKREFPWEGFYFNRESYFNWLMHIINHYRQYNNPIPKNIEDEVTKIAFSSFKNWFYTIYNMELNETGSVEEAHKKLLSHYEEEFGMTETRNMIKEWNKKGIPCIETEDWLIPIEIEYAITKNILGEIEKGLPKKEDSKLVKKIMSYK